MRFTLFVVVVMLMAGASSASAEVIDRVLAVVEGQIITLSDAKAALKFGLVPQDISADPIDAAMKRLIERRLMQAEVERYGPPEPSPETVEGQIAAVRERFKDALAFETALNQSALSIEELRRFMRDSLRIQEYIRQRFTSSIDPPEEEIARYYREHSSEFTVNGELRPLQQVRDLARARVLDERRQTAINEWIEGLRRRATVVVLYLPGRGAS